MRIMEWYPEDWIPEEERTGDRRQSDRSSISFEVVAGMGPESVRARACDVSPTGIQTEGEASLTYPIEAVVPMLLCLPGRPQPLRASATLIWSNGVRAGFEFVAMTDADRLEIAEMVDRVGRFRAPRRPGERRTRGDGTPRSGDEPS